MDELKLVLDDFSKAMKCLDSEVYKLKAIYNQYEIIRYVYEDKYFKFNLDTKEECFFSLFHLFDNVFLSEVKAIEKCYIQLFEAYRKEREIKKIQESNKHKKIIANKERRQIYTYDNKM